MWVCACACVRAFVRVCVCQRVHARQMCAREASWVPDTKRVGQVNARRIKFQTWNVFWIRLEV